MDVSQNSGTPKSSILIGFSIIFTIHFGVPLFLETPIYETYDICRCLRILHHYKTTPPGRRRRTVRTDSISVEDGSHERIGFPPKIWDPRCVFRCQKSVFFELHAGKLTWNPRMEVDGR